MKKIAKITNKYRIKPYEIQRRRTVCLITDKMNCKRKNNNNNTSRKKKCCKQEAQASCVNLCHE